MASQESDYFRDIEGVVWDFDGVLVNTYYYEFSQNLFHLSLGHGNIKIPKPPDSHEDYVVDPSLSQRIVQRMIEAFQGCDGDPRRNYEILYGQTELYEGFEENHQLGVERFKDLVIPTAGAFDTLEQVATSGLAQALWTSRTRKLLKPELTCGIVGSEGPRREGFFDLTISADDVGSDANGEPLTKPHPRGLDIISRKLRIPTERLVMIGDRPSDIIPAKKRGAKTIGLTGAGFAALVPDLLKDADPDALASDVRDVKNLLFG